MYEEGDSSKQYPGSLATTVIFEHDPRTAIKYFKQQPEAEEYFCVAGDDGRIESLTKVEEKGSVPLLGLSAALTQLHGYHWLQGQGLPKLLTPEPLVQLTRDGTRAVAFLRFHNGGPCLQDAASTSFSVHQMLRAIPGALRILATYFSLGVVHQNIHSGTLLFDGEKFSLVGTHFADASMFRFLMRHPDRRTPCLAAPKDAYFYAMARAQRKHGSKASPMDVSRVYSDWTDEEASKRLATMDQFLILLGCEPAFSMFQPDGILTIAKSYETFFGNEKSLKQEDDWILRSRMNAVDSYMLAFTLLEQLSQTAIGLARSLHNKHTQPPDELQQITKHLQHVVKILRKMICQNVQERLLAKDALALW
jgi:hypothetical protein